MMTRINGVDLDDFTASYLETALWATTISLPVPEDELCEGKMDVDEDHALHDIRDGDNYDDHFGLDDFTVEALRKACEDCDVFRVRHGDDLCDEDDCHAGHNFWLNRNGHGCGFWDGGYEEEKGERLSAGCEEFGELHVWVDNDGTLGFE